MKVRHQNGEYDVSVGDHTAELNSRENSFLITDRNVASHYAKRFAGPQFAVPPGEHSKSIAQYGALQRWLADSGASRSSTIIALGGGVVGDLAGFVAATYMRGIRYVQIPTTLLSMVDSSVGGKVAINLEEGKNLVGAFYPPEKVVIDFQTLSTLPDIEFNSGAAEIWKCGLIMDMPLFERLEFKPLGPGDERLGEIVMRCVEHKRSVVEDDEHETTGRRAILNFGHTVGHAIEMLTHYEKYLHGQAIAVGMIIEADLGERLGCTPKGLSERIRAGLIAQGLPDKVTGVGLEDLVLAMKSDKKAGSGTLAFALLDGYGSCKLMPDVPEKVVLECLRDHI